MADVFVSEFDDVRRHVTMRVSIFAGDLCDVRAEALCTSTNPRLSLVMGTGASVRGRGGYGILRECEAIVDAAGSRELPPGSAHQTSAGELAAKIVIHCVASDAGHRSSAAIIRDCVVNALALADAAGCESVALPVFATGHARARFEDAVRVMAETLRDQVTAVRHVIVVVYDSERADAALRVMQSVVPNADVDLQRGPATEELVSMWAAEW
jgi:O-acetyl-ADP-ribose deacetylase (regulator of RNase III)